MKFANDFNLILAIRTTLRKTKRIMLAPFDMFYRKIKQLFSPNSIFSRVGEDVRAEVRGITKKPKSLDEYFLVGEHYFAKKMVW